jgi:hypothetical protein
MSQICCQRECRFPQQFGAILFLLGADHNPRLLKTAGSAHFLAYPGAGL